MLGKLLILVYCGRVAQLDRVPGYEPGGRRFDSCRVRHIEKTSLMAGFFSPPIPITIILLQKLTRTIFNFSAVIAKLVVIAISLRNLFD